MKRAILLSLLIIPINNLSSQWVTVRSVSSEQLFCCHFINSSTGWAGGSFPGSYAFITKTTNGGLSWQDVFNTTDNDRVEAIMFIDSNFGWAGTYGGKLIKTTNGGLNWTTVQVLTGSSSRIRRIQFVNSLTGWIGSSGGYYRSNDGGDSWSFLNLNSSPVNIGYGMYFFPNSLTGYLCTSQSIFKTTNGGDSYTNVYSHNSGEILSSVKFINQDTGWVMGFHRIVIKTTNGGINWTTLAMDSIQVKCHEYIFDSDFINGNVGYAVGQKFCGGIWGTSFSPIFWKTTNGGLNWSFESFSWGGLTSIEDIQFASPNIAYAVSYYGTVFKNTNAGLVGLIEKENIIPDKFSLLQNYPNPFNPTTKISYSIPTTQYTILKVYDALGREIQTLVNQKLASGTYETELNGSNLSSGIYFYKLETENFTEVKRMMLLK